MNVPKLNETIEMMQRDLGQGLIAADIFNYDGVFAEAHPNPPDAVSDGDCQLFLSDLEDLVKKAKAAGEL